MHRIQAGRPLGRPLRYRSQAMKKERGLQATKKHGPWPNCRGFPWEARQRDFITAYSSIMAGFYEPRIMNHGLFHGFRCGIPPRQTQTNNDASGSPQRVAGRPPLLSVLITGPVPDGPERLGTALTESQSGDGNNASHRSQKNTANGLVRRGRLGKAARCEIRSQPIRV